MIESDNQSTIKSPDPVGSDPLDITPASVPPPLDLVRSELLETMPSQQFEVLVQVTRDFLERRFATMQKLTSVASKDVNINPFLMLAMAPAYNIYSPFEAAEYAQNAKLPHGDATAFGRFIEEKVFPVFGTTWPPEKPRGSAAIGANLADASLFSSIDGELIVDGRRYLATYKSGPWTMNQSHANEMIANFPEIHRRTGCDIIIAITYGKRDRVNNKPGLVLRGTGTYTHILVGRQLWEFVTGVKDAHLHTFKAIRTAQQHFAIDHGGKTFFEHLIEARLKLSQSFREAFDLVGSDDDMWERIFKGSF